MKYYNIYYICYNIIISLYVACGHCESDAKAG